MGSGSNLVAGQSGDDYIDVSASAATAVNTVYAGAGDDIVLGGDSEDLIRGEDDDDELYGAANIDQLYDGDGNDEIYGGDEPDQLHGGPGDDALYGGSGTDEIWGDEGDDTLSGGDGGDILVPGAGTDAVSGGAGNDIIEIYDPCEIGSGSTVDGGAGTDILRVPLPLNAGAMSGLSVTNVETIEVIDVDLDPLWRTGAACASTEPTQWAADSGTGLRWRPASATERRTNGWSVGTILVEVDTSEVAHGHSSLTFRTPGATGGLIGTPLDFDMQQSGIPFDEIHIPGTVVSRTPVFRRFLEHPPTSGPGAWGWVILDDYGGLAGWVNDGNQTWGVHGSESNALIEPYPLPASDPSAIDDYLIFEPALMTTDLDVVTPQAGDPYDGHVAGEGRFCTSNRDNWMVELLVNVQTINQVMQEPVGPGVLFDLQYAYCNIFETLHIYHDSFLSDYRVYDDRRVAFYCDGNLSEYEDSGHTVRDELELYSDWPQNHADSYVSQYWGLHLIDCVDDDEHPYTFEGCGSNPYCYRDRVFEDSEHAALHITGGSTLLGHLVSVGPFTHPGDAPVEPWTVPQTGVRGAATFSEVGYACNGTPQYFDACPGGGASVSMQPKGSIPASYWVPAHEVAHNFDATHDLTTVAPPNGCTTAYTIMAGGIDLTDDTCIVKQFTTDSLNEMTACMPESECPRASPAP